MQHRARLCLLALPLLLAHAAAQTRFTRDFAPTDAWVTPQEAPYRATRCLNGAWQFQPVPMPREFARDSAAPPELPLPAADRWEKTPIKIPSPWNVNDWGNGRRVGAGTGHPYRPDSVYYPSYPEAWDRAEMGWLRRRFTVPAEWEGVRVVLHFEAVAGACQVLVDGCTAGEHFDRFLPFELDITALVRPGGEHELLVGVRHHRLFNRLSAKYRYFRAPYPPGSELERIVGIWQDVYLLGVPKASIEDVFVQPLLDRGTLRVEVTVRNDGDSPREVAVGGNVHPWRNLAPRDGPEAPEPAWELAPSVLELAPVRAIVAPGARAAITRELKVAGELRPWSPEAPNLHALVLSLEADGAAVDRRVTRFGWRQFALRGRDVLLNGSRLQMFGDLSHPFGPFMMSRRFAWAWYRLIKDFGGNAVRPHAQPYPRAYLDLADEMGLVVLDETALFGSSIQLNFEDEAAWRRFEEHYDGLVLRDRNHPSVIGWSFGNELFAIFELNRIAPADASAWYEKLAELGRRARRLDPTRDWISCDGDDDLRGTLPVWSKHLGHGLHPIADVAKPRMVGESGGTYYATPKQLSVFNGDRAYADYAGRNEALAIDLYQNVVALARPQLAYFSPSEMVWFGVEHLPLGFNDFARLPTLADGVFFEAFEDGKAGMQPERLPPYVTTLNPGYDPTLPLYRPLAMFQAMRAALAPGGPAACPWDHAPKLQNATVPAPRPTIAKAVFAGDRSSVCYRKLTAWGVQSS